jgi:hypothetical protein
MKILDIYEHRFSGKIIVDEYQNLAHIREDKNWVFVKSIEPKTFIQVAVVEFPTLVRMIKDIV